MNQPKYSLTLFRGGTQLEEQEFLELIRLVTAERFEAEKGPKMDPCFPVLRAADVICWKTQMNLHKGVVGDHEGFMKTNEPIPGQMLAKMLDEFIWRRFRRAQHVFLFGAPVGAHQAYHLQNDIPNSNLIVRNVNEIQNKEGFFYFSRRRALHPLDTAKKFEDQMLDFFAMSGVGIKYFNPWLRRMNTSWDPAYSIIRDYISTTSSLKTELVTA